MRFDRIPTDWAPWTTSDGVVMTTQSGEPIYFLRSINFPCTIAEIVEQAANVCRVPFTQDLSGLPNADISISELPTTTTNITYRMLIQWCAGIMGTNAWVDWDGELRFSWYENATDYVSTIDNRYSSDLYENDLTVTGVVYTNNDGVEMVDGTDDYALDLTGNSFVGPVVTTVLPAINAALNGFSYRPFTAAVVNAPYLWPMDIVTFTDKDGNNHTCALTNVAFGLNGTTALESKGMTYATNRRVQPSGFTKEQAQLVNEVKQSIVDLDDSLTQQEIFNRLTDNGAAQGMVLYNGQLYINASYINAGIIANVNNQNNYWNLLTGEFSTKQGTLGDFTIDSHGLSRSGQAGIMYYDIALNLNGIQYQNTNAGNDVDRTRLGYGTLSLARKEDGKGWAISEIIGSQDSDTGASIFKVNVLGEGQDLNKATRIAVTSKDHSDGGALTVQGGLNVTGGVAFGTPLPVASGGTGANTAAGARTNIGAAAASDVTHVYRDVNLIGHPLDTSSYVISFETVGKNIYITFRGDSRAHTVDEVFMVIPEGYRSGGDRYFPAAINNTACGVLMQSNGNVSIWTSNPASGRIFLAMSYCIE